MTWAIWFWILMLLYVLFGFVGFWPANAPNRTFRSFGPFGYSLILFLILLVIGCKDFGSPFPK